MIEPATRSVLQSSVSAQQSRSMGSMSGYPEGSGNGAAKRLVDIGISGEK